MEDSEPKMMSEFTWNSPHGNNPNYFSKKGKGELASSRKSHTILSKYTSSSRLTKSRIFDTLSRKNEEARIQESLNEKETEIEVLQNSLEGIQKSHRNLLFEMAKNLSHQSNIAEKLRLQVENQ